MRQFYLETILPQLLECTIYYWIPEDEYHECSGIMKPYVIHNFSYDRETEQLEQYNRLFYWAIWFLKLINQLEAKHLPALPAPAEMKYLTLPDWQRILSSGSPHFFKRAAFNKMTILQQTVTDLQQYAWSIICK